MRERWSWEGSGLSVKKAGVMLTAGKPNTAGFLYHRYHFAHDDFLELRIELTLAPGNPAARSANAFIAQIAPLQTRYDGRDSPNSMIFTGLAVMVLGPDAAGRYFATYRYFHRETVLSQEYLDLLAERRGDAEGCELPDVAAVEALVLQMDFEGANSLEVQYEQGGQRASCFVVKGYMQYVSSRAFYLSLKARSGPGGFAASVRAVVAREKAHSLDVEEELHVSHGLVGEIFDKVAVFTERLNADAEGLRGVAELQTAVLQRADQLEAYARDLFFGTKRFQEFIIETLSEHRVFTPENLPKMEMIRNKIDELNAKQQKFYDLFTALRGLLASKKLFAKTQTRLERVQQQLEDVRRVVASRQFGELLERSQTMMNPLKNLTFSAMLNSVIGAESQPSGSAKLLALNGSLAVGILATLTVFGVLILRKVSSFEISQLN